MNKLKIAVIGAGGLVAEALMGLLSRHKHAEMTHLVSETYEGKDVSDIHGRLSALCGKKFTPYNRSEIAGGCDVIFLVKQPGETIGIVKDLMSAISGKKTKTVLVDFSADFRLRDPALYKKWYDYKADYPEELLEHAAYGLSELYPEKIKAAKLIANPGCYPTCAVLSLAPLLESGFAEGDIIIDAYSGVSGAGVSQKNMSRNLAMNVVDNMFPYNIAAHRHIPEIEQEIKALSHKHSFNVVFVPHIVGFKYGIAETIYVKLDKSALSVLGKGSVTAGLTGVYEKYYSGKRFVRICPGDKIPELRNVVGTNYCDIGVKFDERTGFCVITGMIDNMIKGAAGQAVQNMNISFGLDEAEGLD